MISEMIITADSKQNRFTDIAQCYPLSVRNCDYIVAVNILQYFDFAQSLNILNNWCSCLKDNGLLKIITEDFRDIAAKYVKGEKVNVLNSIYGEGRNQKSIFDKESLFRLMQAAGLKIELVSQNNSVIDIIGKKAIAENKLSKRVTGLLSVPRLNFSFNRGLAERVSYQLNMPIYSYEGVFWGQTLTRAIESHYKESDYIITMDYDTWFAKQHIEKLIYLAQQFPEADAIVPIQLKRRDDAILAGINGESSKGRVQVNLTEFKKPLMPIITGHFGLTLFKASVFDTLKKPWLIPQPDKDGGWGEGRLDDDIYFWHNFNKCGFKTFLANEVYIGHLDLMVAFAGLPENNFKPIYIELNKIETDIPSHGIPLI